MTSYNKENQDENESSCCIVGHGAVDPDPNVGCIKEICMVKRLAELIAILKIREHTEIEKLEMMMIVMSRLVNK